MWAVSIDLAIFLSKHTFTVPEKRFLSIFVVFATNESFARKIY